MLYNVHTMSKERSMKTKQYKGRNHRALFDDDLPFKARVQKLKTAYTRKPKHKGREGNDE